MAPARRGLGLMAIGVVLVVGGCGGQYQRTTVSDPCRLLDRSLVQHLTGTGRGSGNTFGSGSVGCTWGTDEDTELYLDLRVFRTQRYRDDVRAARRTYEGMTRPAGSRPRF